MVNEQEAGELLEEIGYVKNRKGHYIKEDLGGYSVYIKIFDYHSEEYGPPALHFHLEVLDGTIKRQVPLDHELYIRHKISRFVPYYTQADLLETNIQMMEHLLKEIAKDMNLVLKGLWNYVEEDWSSYVREVDDYLESLLSGAGINRIR